MVNGVYADTSVLLRCYYAFILPILEYCLLFGGLLPAVTLGFLTVRFMQSLGSVLIRFLSLLITAAALLECVCCTKFTAIRNSLYDKLPPACQRVRHHIATYQFIHSSVIVLVAGYLPVLPAKDKCNIMFKICNTDIKLFSVRNIDVLMNVQSPSPLLLPPPDRGVEEITAVRPQHTIKRFYSYSDLNFFFNRINEMFFADAPYPGILTAQCTAYSLFQKIVSIVSKLYSWSWLTAILANRNESLRAMALHTIFYCCCLFSLFRYWLLGVWVQPPDY